MIRATLVGPTGTSAALVSLWVVRAGEDFARFVTACPEGRVAYRVLDTIVLDRDLCWPVHSAILAAGSRMDACHRPDRAVG